MSFFDCRQSKTIEYKGVGRSYVSVDSIAAIDPDDHVEVREFPLEFVHSQTPSGMPPHVLNLKVNSVIILLRNINIRLGFCNGTRLRVVRLHDNLIEAECLKTHQRILIPRMPLTSELDNFPFKLRRLQFPVRPGYAMTGNRAQGQTIERLGIYLPQPFFAHGQLYVTFSRVRNANNVKVLMFDTHTQGRMTLNPRHFFTKNVVYREILAAHLPPQPVGRLHVPNDEQMQQAIREADQAFQPLIDPEPEINNVVDFEQVLDEHLVRTQETTQPLHTRSQQEVADDILSQALSHMSLDPLID